MSGMEAAGGAGAGGMSALDLLLADPKSLGGGSNGGQTQPQQPVGFSWMDILKQPGAPGQQPKSPYPDWTKSGGQSVPTIQPEAIGSPASGKGGSNGKFLDMMLK